MADPACRDGKSFSADSMSQYWSVLLTEEYVNTLPVELVPRLALYADDFATGNTTPQQVHITLQPHKVHLFSICMQTFMLLR